MRLGGEGTGWRQRVFNPIALTVTALLLAACASTTGSAGTGSPGSASPGAGAGSSGTGSGSSGTASTAPGSAQAELLSKLRGAGLTIFDGPGDFYDPPKPLPKGKPGDPIRVQVITPARVNADVVRVMYHSQDHGGNDVAVTGFVAIPHNAKPAGGRPIISWAHGTTGIGPQCAPSKDTIGSDKLAQHYLDLGYVWAATDYFGLGPPGMRHAYLSGVSEGRAVIDIARTARLLPTTEVGANWVVYGHSQGGQSALFAGQLAAGYAPEMHLLGTVSAAPASALPYAAQTLADGPGKAFIVMAIMGMPTDYPQVRPEDYLTDKALAAAKASVDTGCSKEVFDAFKGFGPGETLKANPNVVEPAKSITIENEPGMVKADTPILITHGTADTTVPTVTSKALFDRMCGLHQIAERKTYDGKDHGGVIEASTPDVDGWIAARFAGTAGVNGCQ